MLLMCCGDWLLRLDEAGLITIDICLAGCCDDPTAQIDWAGVPAALSDGRLVGSASDAAVLRIAASLASGHPVNLRDLTASLERRVLAPIQTATPSPPNDQAVRRIVLDDPDRRPPT